MSYAASKIRLVMELRKQGIADRRVLAALERVPREQFVPTAFGTEAYDNIPLPIGQGQTISQPYVVAFMTQALEVGERMKVLEIGTGSGYQAAVLSRLCRRVCTVERFKSLLREAEERFRAQGLHNITTRHGDGYKGWPELAPFERIIVTAAAPDLPPALVDQLAVGGVMIAPLHVDGEQMLVKVTRDEQGVHTENLLAVRFVPLVEGVARSAD